MSATSTVPGSRETIAELREPTRAFRKAVPEAWGAFQDLHRLAMADGALPRAIKELMALAIAVAEGCDGCIAYHAHGAVAAGATREQAADALGVALLMTGGPATAWAPRALAAFDEFAERRT